MVPSLRASYRLTSDPLPANETRFSRKEPHSSFALRGKQLASDVLPNFQPMYARRPFQPG